MKEKNASLREVDRSDYGLEQAYRLSWEEDETEKLVDYLEQNNFELFEEENPLQLRYEEDGEVKAAVKISQDTAYMEVYMEIYDSEDMKDDGNVPIALQSVLQKREEFDLDSWLSGESPSFLLTESEIKEGRYDKTEGVPLGGHPKDYNF